MRSAVTLVLAALVAAVTSIARAEVPIQEVTSPGGIKAWLVEEHGIPFTALEVRFRGGTALDPEGRRGVTSLMTGLLEEGAGDLDSQGFAARREDLAADIRFDADSDSLSVSARLLTANRAEAAALLKSALTDARFDPVAIDRVRGQILSMIRDRATSPDDVAGDAFAGRLFGTHPYGTSDLGTEASMTALTRDDILDARDAVIARDRLYVAAAGDITPDELGALLDDLFAGLPATGAPMPPRVEAAFDGGTEVFPFASPQSVILFGQPGLRLTDPDYYPAMVLNQIIGGGGFSSLLMDEVREKRGLTYGVSSDLVSMDLAEGWYGSLSSSNDKTADAISVIRDVWSQAADNGISADQLAAAKTFMTGSYPLRFDGNRSIARILVGMQMEGLPITYPAYRNSLIEGVTLEQVNDVARRRLSVDALTFVVVGEPDGLQTSP